MFQPGVNISMVNQFNKNTMVEHLGIEITEVGADFMRAKMPVDQRTKQPLGLLHGGASMALAETLGSVAAHCVVNPEKQYCVGLEINGNHIKSVKEGWVYAMAKPHHIGRKTQVWEIRITNESNDLVCISRITMAVMDKK
ncbi:hotdog fold thioesterase [uncultured Roseivirga sp.]|uniref:hotdog fold thioesterase n=2 Tax=uncultured Roseivirga sp. TaxID=543088 RepID=UPI0030D749E7|tara:strand:- start:57935 stop:58354 length:420 start_codon:yes stop_codon:yes gene_type:complete